MAVGVYRRRTSYPKRRKLQVQLYPTAGGGTTVTPTTLALVLTAYAPTVSTPQTLTPTTLALTLSTFAPTVSTPILATPTTAALVLTAFEPTVTATAHVVATPTTATLTLTAFEPTVTAGGSATVTPTTAALTLTTFAPTVTAGGDQTVTPTTATLTLATFAPTVSTPQTVTPTTLALTLTTFSPTVSTPQTVTPTTLALTLTTFAPTVTGVAPITVTPSTLALVLTTYAPTITSDLADPIWTIDLSLTGRRTAACLAVTTARSTDFAWNATVPLPQTVTPTTLALSLTTFAPTITVAFNPLTDPDLVGLWVMLDASDNGTTITAPDRSPNSYTMTATGADRPAISTTGFCNQKGITSDQGTWKGISSSAIGASMVGNQQLSMIFLLGNVTDPGATRPFATYGTGYAGCFDVDVKYVTRGRLRANFIQAGGLTRCEMRTIADSEVLIAPKTVAVTFDGSLGSNQVIGYYQDGVLIPSSYETNGANTTTFPDDSLALCNGFDGVFAGCAVVKRVLSQSEVLEFANYLRDQYGMGTPKQVLWVGDSLVNATQLAAMQSQYATDRAATPALWGTYEAIDSSAAAGETIANIQTRLTTDLASGAYRQPTHILLHNCGTNDLLNGASAATIATRWEALLAHVHSLRPGVPIKLLSLIKNTASAGAFTQIVIDANALGPTAVANAIAANPGMVATWSNNAYDVTLLDGTHPTSPVGENEIAAVLWPIIKAW